jgi:MFS family permease
MTITSFLSDVGHEMVTVVLPGFLHAIAVPAGALGWIEGSADGAASFLKLGTGWISDRIGRRKPIVAGGYFVTTAALALLAAAVSWPLVAFGRVLSWMGRGIRSPLRDAMLADAVTPEVRGKVFGLHRAGDTVGAVLGPLLGVYLLARLPHLTPAAPFRMIFLISLVPGLGAVAAFVLLVREHAHAARRGLRLHHALRQLQPPFRRFLRGVGVFGLGDFSHTLLILAATQMLAPVYGLVRAAQFAGLLYVLHNLVYAAASFPIGALADRMSKPRLLAAGYALGGLTTVALALLITGRHTGLAAWAGIFAAAGAYLAAEDALEGAVPADLLAPALRGTGYGVMGAVNGVGDFAASALVGAFWELSPAAAFGLSAALMLTGAALMAASAAPEPAAGPN